MSLVLASHKGRSGRALRSFTLREAAAHAFATASKFFTRWIASERNTADGPSRLQGITRQTSSLK
eukprot:10784620-Karenia_brevis.AAC.1